MLPRVEAVTGHQGRSVQPPGQDKLAVMDTTRVDVVDETGLDAASGSQIVARMDEVDRVRVDSVSGPRAAVRVDVLTGPEDEAFLLLGQLAHGFMRSQVLFVACELGVFEVLAEAPEPLDAVCLSTQLHTCPQATQALLDACVSLRLLTCDPHACPVVYSSTILSRVFLSRGGRLSQTQMLRYSANTLYPAWAQLAHAIREGQNQHLRAFGVSSQNLFSAIYRSKEEQLLFLEGLQEMWGVHGPPVLMAFDLSIYPRICDLGGGLGGLARLCAALYPTSQVTVLDLPEVVDTARARCPMSKEACVDFVKGDFFGDPLPPAELFVLARVLHDWTDQACCHLLGRIHAACPPGGAVLVIESLLAEDGRGPLDTQLLGLNMLLLTEGRERSAVQYSALLTSAGFRPPQVGAQGRLYSALLAAR